MKKQIRYTVAGCALALVAACSNHSPNAEPFDTVPASVVYDNGCPNKIESTSCAVWGSADNTLCVHGHDEIKWAKKTPAEPVDFVIAFKSGHKRHVCDTSDPDDKKCKVKQQNGSAFGNADGLVFKYTLEGPSGSTCPPVDPIIIVMK